MKRKTVLLVLLMAMFAPLAMQAQELLSAPRNNALEAVDIQNLATQEIQLNREAGWLQYDNGPSSAYGSDGNYLWVFASMFPSSMLGDNNTLTQVAFYEVAEYFTGNITVDIYSGGDSAPSTPLYSETVSPTGNNGWHLIELSQPVTFDPNQNLWISISAIGSYVLIVSSGATDANSQWIYWSDEGWENSGIGMGWTIRGYVDYIDADCPKPTNLSASDITAHTATLSWRSSDEIRNWEIVYSDLMGFDPDQATPIQVSEDPYTLTGLDASTTYYAYVRSACGSDWSDMVSFTTEEACPKPQVSVLPYVNSANVSWTGTSESYDLQWMEYTMGTPNWLVYDDGTMASNVGSSSGGIWTWGVMYPAESINGNYLTHVAFYEVENTNYLDDIITVKIYSGGVDEPETLIGVETVTLDGIEGMHDIVLSTPVEINNRQNLWIILTANAKYCMAMSAQDGGVNSRWFFDDEDGWMDFGTLFTTGATYSFMIRGGIETLNPETWTWNSETDVESPYPITGLDSQTDYVVRVKGDCGDDGESVWTWVFFTTPSSCDAPIGLETTNVTATTATLNWIGYQNNYTVRYREAAGYVPVWEDDFENGIGNDWTIIAGIGAETVGTNPAWYAINPTSGLSFEAHSGSYCASSWSWNGDPYHANNWLITPQIDLQGILKYYVRTNAGYPDKYEVLISTSTADTTSFRTLQPLALAPATGEWEEVTIDLSGYTGMQGYIAIRHLDYDGNYICIDDFGIYALEEAGDWVEETTTDPTLLISGLTAETDYEWQVQGVCDSGTTDWSEMSTFITPPSCVVPTQLAVTDVGTNRAMATWTSDAEYFDIELNGVVIEEDYTGTTYGLNLEPATVYTLRVRANCGTDGYSQWTEPVVFITECSGAKDLPYTYDFENIGEYYACWYAESYNDENEYGVYWEDEEHTNRVFVFSSWYEADDYTQVLISPELNATTPVSVQFDYKVSSPYAYESFLVGYATEEMEYYEWPYEVYETNNEEWMTFSGVFPEGTKYVAIYYFSDFQYYLFLDNFRFEVPKTFVTDGDWDDANNWLPVGVPTWEDNVSIEAEAIIPADYIAEVNNIIIGEDGSITIEDGGQLYHSTYGLEVTMKKNVPAYTGTTDNYQLLASPFVELYTSPGDLTSAEGNDFYMFDNSQPGEEWQNNKQVEIEELYIDEGYLYANPEGIELSLTGSTMPSNVYYEGYINYESVYLYYDDTENEVNGWYLLGNPFIVDAYIYEGIYDEDGYIEDLIPMNVMYYDENGDMQTIESGPIAPMQGFFVSVTEEIEALIFPFDILNAKNMPSLKSLKKRNGNNITIPAKKLSSINADKSTQPLIVEPMMSVKANAVKSEKKAVKLMSVKK